MNINCVFSSSSKKMFVNRLSTLSLAINLLELNLPTSLAMENESSTAYSFSVRWFKIGTRCLTKSYVVCHLPTE